jgi:glycerol uptake facilitator-like aquaporin
MRKGQSAPEVNWHAVVDGFAVEFVSTFMVCYSVLASWCEVGYVPPNDWAAEFVPAVAMALSVICVRDKDGVFADTSPFVTLIEACIGAYDSGVEIASRVAGQLAGAAVAMLLSCTPGAGVADMTERHAMPPVALVAFNAASTAMALITVLYVVVPLLPPKPMAGPPRPMAGGAGVASVTLAMTHWFTWRYLQLLQTRLL